MSESGAKVVSDIQTLDLIAMEELIGEEFNGTIVKFGSIGRDAEAEFIRNDGTPSGLSVANIVTFHEFGLGVPIRSSVGAWTDGHKRDIGDTFREGVENLLDGFGDAQSVGEAIGEMASVGIGEFIEEDNVRPELGDWWLHDPWRDPDGIPLFDTGQIVGSMSFEVETG